MNRTLELVKTVYEIGQLKELFEIEGPQVALAGRSNVGKSSLVNCLAGRKSLAKISSTPGKTRSLNFYAVHPGNFYLVDLPGYGYARCSKAERQKWAKLIDAFIKDNRWLQGVATLLDSRLTPQRLDLEMTSYLQQAGIPLLAVLTKTDKVKQRDRSARQKEWRDLLHTNSLPLCFSSKTGMGRDNLWNRLAAMALGEEAVPRTETEPDAAEKKPNAPSAAKTPGKTPEAAQPPVDTSETE